MATVHLARAYGAAGFERWFAVKRIHPHLAKHASVVAMFLDEARIAASLDHPNLAQVFDLGHDRGEYFMGMEYLHGEHLGGVVERQGALPLGIAARIVADAAYGLHHAHEALDAHGRLLSLVHRDVSPQNIFVTYDGQVKVTDFGIVKASHRLRQTDTGGLKGKIGYMSPEQMLGEEVDRRTDVFALGIVLWEITTGRRLFRCDTFAETVLRITCGHVEPPSSIVHAYSPALEDIVLRALSTSRSDRFATAADMACALEEYLGASGAPVGSRDLRSLMHRVFADPLAHKEAILRAGPDAGHAAAWREATAPDVAELVTSALDGVTVVTPPATMHAWPAAARPHGWAGRRVGLAIAVAVAVGLLAALALRVFFPRSDATRPTTAIVRIATDPPIARVTLDGAHRATRTPILIRAAAGARHRLRIERDGFYPIATTFVARADRVELNYALRRR